MDETNAEEQALAAIRARRMEVQQQLQLLEATSTSRPGGDVLVDEDAEARGAQNVTELAGLMVNDAGVAVGRVDTGRGSEPIVEGWPDASSRRDGSPADGSQEATSGLVHPLLAPSSPPAASAFPDDRAAVARATLGHVRDIDRPPSSIHQESLAEIKVTLDGPASCTISPARNEASQASRVDLEQSAARARARADARALRSKRAQRREALVASASPH